MLCQYSLFFPPNTHPSFLVLSYGFVFFLVLIDPGVLKNGEHDRRKELDFAYLFVVDVTRQLSYLLVAGGRELALAQAVTCLGNLRSTRRRGEHV